MTVLMVPPLEDEPYPTLGFQVARWIEENLIFGPGDLHGQPVRLDPEKRALIARMYEIFPRGHPNAGRRRFHRCALSLRKGVGKTEMGAWIVAAELHPDAPVRCVGFDERGNPIGQGVTDPYIPCVAATAEQSTELAYYALQTILAESRVAADFDIGNDRIVRIDGAGKAVSLATAPDARDGARTTFSLADETHRWTLPRLKEAHRVMLANLPKRRIADPWELEITTAPAPGEGSVAEDTYDYARQVATGKIKNSRLFFFHRQAGGDDPLNLNTPEEIRAAVVEASGPTVAWSDIDRIVDQWSDPTTDRAYLERVWLNRLVRSSQRAFDVVKWKTLARPGYRPAPGALIGIGFDGARYHDSTSLVGVEIETGYEWEIGLWERPADVREWEVPEEQVKLAMAETFDTWDVWRAYCDPPYWETAVAEWAGQYGTERVWAWRTNRMQPMAASVRAFANAILAGEISHDGSVGFTRHIGNACRRVLTLRDEKGEHLWVIYKERPDSPHKIDEAMAGILAWQVRCDALAAGVVAQGESVYSGERGLLFV